MPQEHPSSGPRNQRSFQQKSHSSLLLTRATLSKLCVSRMTVAPGGGALILDFTPDFEVTLPFISYEEGCVE